MSLPAAPQPPTYDASHEPGLPYHQLHRASANQWWRSLVGLLILLLSMFIVVPGFLQVITMIVVVARGTDDLAGDFEQMLDLDDVTPFLLAYINLSLAALIPVVLLLTWSLHRLRPGFATSVFGRMRWGYFFVCTGMAFVALLATLFVSALMPSDVAGEQVSTQVNSFDTQTLQFLLVVLLLTPFQAAGEEYAFRGYLTQLFGARFPAWVAVVAPAVLFALAHGAQDPPIFVDRLAFGLVAGVLVVRTGGLEAAIAMHVLNNFLAFGLALAFGDMTEALSPTGGSWWSLPVTLTQSLVYLGLALWMARVMGLSDRSDRVVLAGSQTRV